MSGVPQRLPASVYRRRRIAVLGGLLALIAIVVLIIVRPSLGESTVTEAPTEEELAAEAVTVLPCSDTQVEVVALTDQQTYPAGATPSLAMTVKNIGTVECEVEVGTDVQEFVIDSGSRDNPDLIWSSAHCQDPGVPSTIVLQPGEERTTQPIVWDRTRSSPDTCDTTRPTMPGGGASYHLSVKLGPFESTITRQFILQ